MGLVFFVWFLMMRGIFYFSLCFSLCACQKKRKTRAEDGSKNEMETLKGGTQQRSERCSCLCKGKKSFSYFCSAFSSTLGLADAPAAASTAARTRGISDSSPPLGTAGIIAGVVAVLPSGGERRGLGESAAAAVVGV